MWNIVENYLENYGDALGRASKIGKYWISMFTILRFMFLLSIAEPAWGGHGLECNTDTPGCARLCENKFWPLNPTSLWEMQLLAMIIPIGYFVMYSNWRVDKVKLAIQKKDEDYKNHPKRQAYLTKLEKRKEHLKDVEEDLIADKVQFHKLRHRPQARAKREEEEKALLEREDKYFMQLFQTMEEEEVAEKDVNTDTDFGFGDAHAINQYYPMLYFWYFCVVMVRTAIEISFCFFYYMLYYPNFFMVMPMVYLCHDNNEILAPCNGIVECYVDRPYSKTLTIWAMFAFSFFTIIMGFLELWTLGLGNCCVSFKNRKIDITKDYKVSTMEQQFAQQQYVQGGGFVQFQGTRVDHQRDEIGDDPEGPQLIGI